MARQTLNSRLRGNDVSRHYRLIPDIFADGFSMFSRKSALFMLPPIIFAPESLGLEAGNQYHSSMKQTPRDTLQKPPPLQPLSVYQIAGVDEVGRGPLAGPVVAAAVILNPDKHIEGLLDSKLLNEARREELDVRIRQQALAFCIAEASVAEIDELNILHASLLAMKRAVEGLELIPDLALIDGNRCPDLVVPASAIVKGDQRVQSISAASIIAKVARDKMMVELDLLYPQYGLAKHKGYPTAFHRQAIIEHGVTDFHRLSFKPVREVLERAATSTGTVLT